MNNPRSTASVAGLFTGWKGWQMIYRYHVGASDEGEPAYREPRRTT